MKKLIMAAILLALVSCNNTIHVMMDDGKVVDVDIPNINYHVGDTVVLSYSLSFTEYDYYGKWVGKLPYNPNPCSTWWSEARKDSITVCTFYYKGIIIR